ncbi:MAG: N-acetyltransferase family protein [Pacificimonas sp.]
MSEGLGVGIRRAKTDDLSAIRAIMNDAIANTTAWYDTRLRTEQDVETWFADKRAGGWPVFVAVDQTDQCLGFGTFDVFRARPAYSRTVEHSVYLSRDARGLGAGRLLVDALVCEAEGRELHVLIGGVDSENTGSIAFHEAMGFREVARLPEVGYKFDRWLTMVFMQRILGEPE